MKDVFSNSFDKNKIERIFIIDPGCFKESGHNIDLVSRFGNELKKKHEVIVCAPKGKDKFIKQGFKFQPIANLYPVLYVDEYSNKYVNAIYEKIVQLSRTIFGLPVHNYFHLLAFAEVKKIIKKI